MVSIIALTAAENDSRADNGQPSRLDRLRLRSSTDGFPST
jgi:hypothetical protein